MKLRPMVLAVSLAALLFSYSYSGTHASTRAPAFDPVPKGWPKLLAIPKIGVRAPVEALAYNRASDYDAPYRWGDVAWYDRGPRPGDVSHANVFGHLDSYCCPAIFYRLKDLRKGDHVYVGYQDGQVLTFQVQWSETYWNNKLPLKFMYGAWRDRGMVLMTCAGYFHRDGTGYDHKLIVFASLVWPRNH